MSNRDELSYYEIALTNRQVLVAFVLILGSVLGAFLCGVWLGRQGVDPLLGRQAEAAETTPPAALEELEPFRFFSDKEATDGEKGGAEALRKPDLSRLLEEPAKDSTLAEDVGSRNPAKPADAERAGRQRQQERQQAEATKPPPSPGPEPAPARSASPPPPAVGATADPLEEFIVQVFSTHDEPQARKVVAQLEGGGFQAFISPISKDEGKMYRVRIGPFGDRERADEAAQRIRKKFKLDTWVTAASN